MTRAEARRLQLSYWLAVGLLIVYIWPLVAAALSYPLTASFARKHFLLYTFVPFLGEKYSLLTNLTRLLAPLVAFLAAFAFRGPRNYRRTLLLVLLLIVGIAASLVDLSLLGDSRNLASLNAHSIGEELAPQEVDLSLERFQEVQLALLATILGLTFAAPGSEKKP